MRTITFYVDEEMYEKLKAQDNYSKSIRDALNKHFRVEAPVKVANIGRPPVRLSAKLRKIKKMLDYTISNLNEDGSISKLSWDDCLIETFDSFRTAETISRRLTFVLRKAGINSYIEAVGMNIAKLSEDELADYYEHNAKIEPQQIKIYFPEKTTKDDLKKAYPFIETMEA